MAHAACRFVLLDVDNEEVQDWYAFEYFEPKVILELHGENAFEKLGVAHSGPVIVVDFLDEALEETLSMVRRISSGVTEGRHEFELTASLWLVVLDRRNGDLTVTLDGSDVRDVLRAQVVGRISVRDWIDAVLQLAREVLDLFRRENPGAHDQLSGWEETAEKLEAWMEPPR